MANTYSQIYLQFVFVVKFRWKLIPRNHKESLHKYITGLVQMRKAKMLSIHAMPDHLHMLIGLQPTIFIPDFVKEIKVASTNFLNDQTWMRQHFQCQKGYAVFSYSPSHLHRVINYIVKQEQHHCKHSLSNEYVAFLKAFGVEYDAKYLFDEEKGTGSSSGA